MRRINNAIEKINIPKKESLGTIFVNITSNKTAITIMEP